MQQEGGGQLGGRRSCLDNSALLPPPPGALLTYQAHQPHQLVLGCWRPSLAPPVWHTLSWPPPTARPPQTAGAASPAAAWRVSPLAAPAAPDAPCQGRVGRDREKWCGLHWRRDSRGRRGASGDRLWCGHAGRLRHTWPSALAHRWEGWPPASERARRVRRGQRTEVREWAGSLRDGRRRGRVRGQRN